MTPTRYRDDLEVELPDEAAIIDETVARMRHLMQASFEQHRHATSATHAKTHGVVAFTAARRTYAEDVMSWRPWFGLAAHRPLGSINRLRRRGYEELGAARHEMNAATEHDPARLADVPD